MEHNLRSRTYYAFKNKGYSKNTKTQEMLGVDWEVAKKHIESQFSNGLDKIFKRDYSDLMKAMDEKKNFRRAYVDF